ncbi:MAG: M20/M25/M40 family metallo-hydrolase [Ignavibacteriaceae bacterium]|nr:M20/M25/M40 family metallo-hydrolase [Chlorobium sp.]MCW8822793.1 M20/M25/M40 family metallo-hydrolase [Ignavibacteriaceae bacterium]
MKNLIILLFVTVFYLKVFPQIKDLGMENIKSGDLLWTVKILSSGEYDGRLSGSEGYNKAANFAAERFKQLGLLPEGDDGFFQYLNVEYNKIDTPAVFNLINGNKKFPYILGKDFVLRGFTGAANITLPVVFCGYGISRPDLGYDDYEKINVENKIVLVFKQSPSWKINDEEWGNEYPRQKSRVAYEHGARGILFVSLPNADKPQPLIGSVMHGEGEQLDSFPQLQISPEVANDFLGLVKISINECQKRIDDREAPNSFLTRRTAEIFVNAKYKNSVRTMNVVSKIEGTDPVLKKEFLVIGAHLDHVGSQAGLLFPGANDNASGSAAVLELAKAFQLSSVKPKRTVLFVLFASEEQGLFGSKYFVENLKSNPDKIIGMFNFDCIGYGDSIQIGNGESSPKLREIARKIDKEKSNLMVADTWNGGGADATPFHKIGIPCLYFVSKYSYDHLHQPTDTPETLNLELLEKIVKLGYLTAREVAEGNYKREVVIK